MIVKSKTVANAQEEKEIKLKNKSQSVQAWAFVSPLAIIITILFVVPLGVLIYMSFMNWPLLGSPSFNGVENYTNIGSNKMFMGAILFTLIYTVIATIVIFSISFILVAISNSPRRGAKYYRSTFFLPYVVGTAAAALIWFSSVNDSNGIANHIFNILGISEGSWGFLDTPNKALFTVLTLVVWKFIGFQVMVLLVGLQSIPSELYEAARMDGANTLQRMRYITLPFLKPTLALLLVLSVTGSLLAFDQFKVLTQGGPDNSTITMVMAIYNAAFTQFSLGKAAAISVILLISLVILNIIQITLIAPKRNKDESNT